MPDPVEIVWRSEYGNDITVIHTVTVPAFKLDTGDFVASMRRCDALSLWATTGRKLAPGRHSHGIAISGSGLDSVPTAPRWLRRLAAVLRHAAQARANAGVSLRSTARCGAHACGVPSRRWRDRCIGAPADAVRRGVGGPPRPGAKGRESCSCIHDTKLNILCHLGT